MYECYLTVAWYSLVQKIYEVSAAFFVFYVFNTFGRLTQWVNPTSHKTMSRVGHKIANRNTLRIHMTDRLSTHVMALHPNYGKSFGLMAIASVFQLSYYVLTGTIGTQS